MKSAQNPFRILSPSNHSRHYQLTKTAGDRRINSLHNTPPLFFLLLLRAKAHHLAVIAHGGAGLLHVAFERPVEPAADHAGRVARHLGVAGAALAVVFAAALVAGEVSEEAVGSG